ncbi:zona pellucida sperm-binding protein 1-like isoform X1 [Bufo bufo]|uniref:zona pellucida sperm-binding protein 1-like isoform X1 n=1 Tax=Bufo bufo TaxID=8384 RepID=UPI001ABE6599|nr:zona pellucida sperm-binding protein 1-like isoform X1 [Bufo bufo]
MVYQLSLTAKADVLVSPLGSITRDSSLMVLSQCLYNNTLSNISLVVLAQQIPTVTSTGVLSVELRISKGSSFSSFYALEDFPLQIPLRELVFLEVRLLQPSDPRLHLRLHQCWGAPNMDPASTLRWPVISNGCPFSEDDTLTQILPGSVPSSYQRFVVSAFTFVGFSNNTEVYFFCSISVCVPSSSESCTTDCVNLTRSRRDQPDISLYLVGTTGPLVFLQQKKGLGNKILAQVDLCLKPCHGSYKCCLLRNGQSPAPDLNSSRNWLCRHISLHNVASSRHS